MGKAQGSSVASDATLTMAEIGAHFPSEWVLLEAPEVDQDFEVIRGQVAWHSKDRDEVDRKAVELRLKHSAFVYTGECPQRMEYVL